MRGLAKLLWQSVFVTRFVMAGASILVLLPPATGHAQETPEAFFSRYVDAVLEGDFTRAATFWNSADVVASQRLGIELTELKCDSGSPVHLFRSAIASGQLRLGVEPGPTTGPDEAILDVTLVETTALPPRRYHLQREGGHWRLQSPVRRAARGKRVIEGELVRVFVGADVEFPPAALRDLDTTAHEILRRFDALDRLDRVRGAKVDYVLCSDELIEEVVGVPTEGVANLQFDGVLSKHRSHRHELVHVLMNVVQDTPGVFSLPVLQEGVAVHLGGRWGKSPAVMQDLGRYLVNTGFVSFGELFTMDGFRSRPAGLGYPVSGLVSGYLLHVAGADGFLGIYRKLSGSLEYLESLDERSIQIRIEEVTGQTWGQLETGFLVYLGELPDSGLGPGVANPSTLGRTSHGLTVAVEETDSAIVFTVRGADAPPNGALLFSSDDSPRSSRLFAELHDQPFPRTRHVILFDANEVGFYDFALDMLQAKFAVNLDAREGYFNEEEQAVHFRLDRSVWPDGVDAGAFDVIRWADPVEETAEEKE